MGSETESHMQLNVLNSCSLFQLFETSAKDDSDCDHVEAIFMTLAHKLKASKPMMPINPSHFPPEDICRAEIMSIGRERNGVEVKDSDSCFC